MSQHSNQNTCTMAASCWEGTKYTNKDGSFRQEDSHWYSPDNKVALVADGLGGHGGGDTASKIVVDVTEKRYAEFPHSGSKNAMHDWLDQTLKQADAEILQAQENGEYLTPGGERLLASYKMAATVVALIVAGDKVLISWAGDSRAYLLRDEKIKQLTKDHTPPGQPGHIVSSCVGASNRNKLTIDRTTATIRPGDRFLIATDGLETLEPEEIGQILASAQTVDEAASQLVDEVMGSTRKIYQDNVTVIVIDP